MNYSNLLSPDMLTKIGIEGLEKLLPDLRDSGFIRNFSETLIETSGGWDSYMVLCDTVYDLSIT